jgi:hypothetical protein
MTKLAALLGGTGKPEEVMDKTPALLKRPEMSQKTEDGLLSLKKKFDPATIARSFMTYGDSSLYKQQPQVTPTISLGKRVGKLDTASYASISEDQKQRMKNGDGLADVAAKLVNFMKKARKELILQKELEEDFREELHEKAKREHQKTLKRISDAKPKNEKILGAKGTPLQHISELGAKADPTTARNVAKRQGETSTTTNPNPTSEFKIPATVSQKILSIFKKAPSKATSEAAGIGKGLSSKVPISTPASPAKTIGAAAGAATAGAGVGFVAGKSIKEKIGGSESGGTYNIMNITNLDKNNSAVVKKGNIGLDGKPYTKNLTDMTIGEVLDLADSRDKLVKQNGAGKAAGKYGFMPGTISDMAKKIYGDKWRDQIFNEETQEALMDTLVQVEASNLIKMGIPVTDATLYMSHFVGPGRVSQLYNANDNDKMSDILGQSASNANKVIAKMTVGEYKNHLRKRGFDFQPIDGKTVQMQTAAPTTGTTLNVQSKINTEMKKEMSDKKDATVVDASTTIKTVISRKNVSVRYDDPGPGKATITNHYNQMDKQWT